MVCDVEREQEESALLITWLRRIYAAHVRGSGLTLDSLSRTCCRTVSV